MRNRQSQRATSRSARAKVLRAAGWFTVLIVAGIVLFGRPVAAQPAASPTLKSPAELFKTIDAAAAATRNKSSSAPPAPSRAPSIRVAPARAPTVSAGIGSGGGLGTGAGAGVGTGAPPPGGRPSRPSARVVSVPLDLDGATRAMMRVLDSKSRIWRAGVDALSGSDAKSSVPVTVGQPLVIAPDPAKQPVPLTRLSNAKNNLPGLIIKAEASPGPAAPQVKTFRLFVQPDDWPMHWDPARGEYVAGLLVGVDAQEAHSGNLDSEVLVQFAARYAEIDPPHVQIGRAGPGGYTRVALRAAKHEPSPLVTVYSELGQLVHPVEVGPRASRLHVTASFERLLGFGLQSTILTVTRLAEDGEPLSLPAALAFTISATGGRLAEPGAVIPKGETQATVNLQSESFGPARVTAVVAGLTSEPLPLRFDFPTGFLLLVTVAGLLGGVIHFLWARRRRRKASAVLILEGLLVGPVLVIATIAGVSVTAVAEKLVQSEPGRFTLALVAGFVGTPVAEMLRKAIFKSPDEGHRATADAAPPPRA